MKSMLKYLMIAGLVWAAVGCGSSDGEEEYPIESLRFEQSSYTESGESLRPRLLVRMVTQTQEVEYDADENPYSMTWSVSDPAVAAVSATGVVTRVAPGTTTLTVRTPLYPSPVTTVVTFEELGDPWVGEWVLATWSGEESLAGKVYLELTREKSFTLYQHVDQLGFARFRGDYAVTGDLLSGTYVDGTPLGDTYTVAADEDLLTLTGTASGAVSTYERTTIPDWVKEEATVTPAVVRGAAAPIL